MADTLRLARGLDLPYDAVTQTFGILAMRGRGKTYTASVLAEQMIKAGLPVVVVDPIGVWWGLRSSTNGQAEGLPVVIFGGDHGDVPLEPGAGAVIADLLVAERMPCILDLSGFPSKADERRFMEAFLTRLYRTNREPLHVIVDEADEFAPQQSFPEAKRLLGAMEQIVRRGRARGLGCTLITQRPAVLNKNVLSQCETLILLGMTGVNDLNAVDAWVGKHADSTEAADVKKSLPRLPIGTAWVWSPAWLDVLTKVKINRRTTFDSSATPKMGQVKVTARRMADVDLDAVRVRIAATVEQAEANDPKVLQAKVRHLERELADVKREWEEEVESREPERVEVPVLTQEQWDRWHETATALTTAISDMGSTLIEFLPRTPDPRLVRQAPATPQPARAVTPSRPPVSPTVPVPVKSSPANGTALSKAQRSVLTVLAQYGSRTKSQTAILAGYAIGGGGFNNALGSLRSAGYIEGKDTLTATAEGVGALGEWEPLPRGRALVEHHARKLTKAAREVLDVLFEAYPTPLTKEEIADRTESQYAPNGGGFNNAMGRLRSLELVNTVGGMTVLADVLMEA